METENSIMKLKDLNKPTPSLDTVAKKHNVPVKEMEAHLKKGIKVELEHTDDKSVAKEIALDHLNELPDYYERLDKVEKDA